MKPAARLFLLSLPLLAALAWTALPERMAMLARARAMPVTHALRAAADAALLRLHRLLPTPPDELADTRDEELQELQSRLVAQDNRIYELQALLATVAEISAVLQDDVREFHPLPARILLRQDLAQIAHSIQIAAGGRDGLEPGMPVVHGATVVGVVDTVAGGMATVRLVTDPGFRAAGLGMDTRVQGIVRGHGSGELGMRFVAIDTPLRAGEIVLTTGTNDRFPKGFLLGTVIGMADPDQNKELDIRIRPAVDLARLEYVVVLRPTP